MTSITDPDAAAADNRPPQETLLHLLDTQPKIHPDFLESIMAKPPTKTVADLAAELEQCKLDVQPLKDAVPLAEGQAPPEVPEELLPAMVPDDLHLGDVLGELAMLERAGVSFGKEENYRLFLALKRLLIKSPGVNTEAGEKIVRVRLWGKLFGQSSDYYVAECSLAARVSTNPPLPDEVPKGIVPPDTMGDEEECFFMQSTNQFVYYVCSAPGQPWTRLPDTNPSTLLQAKNVRRFLTGNLKADVLSKNPFFGKEADLLRAVIARITADTRLAPRGHLADTTDYEGGGDLEVGLSEAGSFLGMTGQALCELPKSSWVHASLDILPQGRNKWHDKDHWTPPEDKPDMKNPKMEKNRPALQSIYLDKAPTLGAPAWSAHVCAPKAPQYSPGVVRSNVWPGALTVGWGYQFVNFYCGWGLPETGTMFAPPALVSFSVQPEPNLPEFARNAKCTGWDKSGDMNLEPPTAPAEGGGAAS